MAMLASMPAIRSFAAQNAAQTQAAPQQTPTFSSNVKVVNVLATVRDKQGQIVRSLTKDDFVLEEDGRPQMIRYFAQQTDLPLQVGLLIDTSGSERRMIPTEKDASYTFLEHVLRPDKDRAFLIHFDREVELLEDLTSSRQKLEHALDQLNRPQFQSGSGNSGGSNDPNSGNGNGGYGGGGGYGGRGGGYGGRRGGGGGAGGTALYDALYLASNDVLKQQSGRKAVIMLTDGEDNGSKVSLGESVTAAQRADTLAYGVRIADEEQRPMSSFGGPGMGRHGGGGWGGQRGGYGQNRPDGKKILQQIARETGGGYFEVSKKKSVDQIYSQIEEELRNQYSLGYTSDRPDTDGGYRKISVTAKQKGLIVQARDGYYAGSGA
ncbi:MAG TPA: VWA domain-containing protein [Bryobacteraceae bacterium]|nr:VWA domain-containing protein [Bryobacteraceae bacterium]